MAETAAKTAATPVKFDLERVPDFQRVYSNNVQVYAGPFDVRLDFGDAEQVKPDLVKVTQKVQVVMSIDHAMAFLDVLGSLLQNVPKRVAVQAPHEKRAN